MNLAFDRMTWATPLIAVGMLTLMLTAPASAYDRWSQNDDATNCRSCHGDFRSNAYISPTDGQNHPNIPTDACNQDGSEDFAGATQGQDNDGDGLYDGDDSDCVETAVPSSAPAAMLVTNFPNPFNPQTTIRFAVDTAGPVRLSVYSVDGVLVRVLRAGNLEAGSHDQRWDGTDSRGRPVTSGLYLCRLETATASLSRPMTLVR